MPCGTNGGVSPLDDALTECCDGDGPITYMNPDDETDIEISDSPTAIKITTTSSESGQANEISEYITACLEAGNPVGIEYTFVGGVTSSGTITSQDSPFPQFSGQGTFEPIGVGKVESMSASCAGDCAPALSTVGCNDGRRDDLLADILEAVAEEPKTVECFDINAAPEEFPVAPSSNLAPGDAESVVAYGTRGQSVTFTAPETNKPSQTVSTSTNGGAVNYQNAGDPPSEVGEYVRNTISFTEPAYLCLRTPGSVTAINQSDQFKFTAPPGVGWVVNSSVNADISISGSELTVTGSDTAGTGGGQPFAEFDLGLTGPVSSLDVEFLTVAELPGVNNGRFELAVKEYPVCEIEQVKLCPTDIAAIASGSDAKLDQVIDLLSQLVECLCEPCRTGETAGLTAATESLAE